MSYTIVQIPPTVMADTVGNILKLAAKPAVNPPTAIKLSVVSKPDKLIYELKVRERDPYIFAVHSLTQREVYLNRDWHLPHIPGFVRNAGTDAYDLAYNDFRGLEGIQKFITRGASIERKL